VTKVPVDKIIETVHTAWERGHVETVPGWGAVWRTQPAWTPEELATLSQNKGESGKTLEELVTSTQDKSGDKAGSPVEAQVAESDDSKQQTVTIMPNVSVESTDASSKTQDVESGNLTQHASLPNLPLQPARQNVSFDPNVKMVFRDEKDVVTAIERLRQMGHEVEELRYHGELVGYRVGDVYIARRPRTWYEPESWAVAEIPDPDLGYKWAVGYRYRTEWGDLNYVKKELEKKAERKALDEWMSGLEQYGYKVRKVKWGPEAAVPGFTYIIEKDGKRIGEVNWRRSAASSI
jgi:hypothetical protein